MSEKGSRVKRKAAGVKSLPARSSPAEDLRAAVCKILPAAFQDGEIQAESILQILGKDQAPDRYQFQWAEKNKALQLAAAPPSGTLAPDLRRSQNFFASRNAYIEAENLEALKIISRAYAGRVKMIYIDPPYNTGNDFVYNDKFAVGSREYMAAAGMLDGKGKASKQARAEVRNLNGHKHSAWLSMMLPRLSVARGFLAPDGVIFASIDDNEVHHLRMLMNQIFGAENFVAQIAWQGMDTVKNDAQHFSTNAEFILAYANNLDEAKIHGIRKTEKQRATYINRDSDPRGDYLLTPLHAKSGTESAVYEFTFPNGQTWRPPEGRYPTYSKSTLQRLVDEGRIYLDPKGKTTPQKKTYWSETSGRMRPTTFWRHEDFGSTRQANVELRALMGRGIFDNPKPVKLIKTIADLMTEKDDIVVDFFSGSATTAHAVMELNAEDGGKRRCVSIQFPQPILEDSPARKTGLRTIADIGRERLIRAGAKIREQANGNIFAHEVDIGFRYFRWSESADNWPDVRNPKGAERWGNQLRAREDLAKKAEPLALLSEAMLRMGYPLCASVEEKTVKVPDPNKENGISCRVFHVTTPGEGGFYFCAEPSIPIRIGRALGMGKMDLLICREDAVDDNTAITIVRRHRLMVI